MGWKKCIFPACGKTSATNPDTSFFRFPKNHERFQLWSERCGKATGDVGKDCFICEDHFLANDFVNLARKRLVWNAAPNLPPALNNVEIEYVPEENVASPSQDIIQPEPTTPLAPNMVPPDPVFVTPLPERPEEEHVTPANSAPAQLTQPDAPRPNVKASHSLLREFGMRRADVTPRRRKLMASYKKACRKINHLLLKSTKQKEVLRVLNSKSAESAMEILLSQSGTFSPAMARILQGEFRNHHRPPKARQWNLDDKLLALAIMKRSPRCYDYMRHVITLPSPKTLRNLLGNITFRPGINEKIITHLGERVAKMSDRDKCCVILFDEMSLRSGIFYNATDDSTTGFEDYGHLGTTRVVANHALVVMVRGLSRKWKQPVAYYFTCDTVPKEILADLLKHVITALLNVGLNVIATVCDQGPTNRGAVKILHGGTPPTSDDPFFFVEEKKIFVLYDPPHLVKCMRNLFYQNDISWADDQYITKTARWDHLQTFYELDQQGVRMALKLTGNHLNPEGSYKMRVNLAAQMLSHTVAAAVMTMASFGDGTKFPKEALDTGEFVETMDQLFDSFNGSTLHPDRGKSLRCCLSDKSPHLEFWKKLRQKVLAWKFHSRKTGKSQKTPPTVHGILVSMSACAKLWEHLKNEEGFKFINMRKLNQDAIENLFGVIRQHGVCNVNPTTVQFVASLKTATITNLSCYKSRGKNCEDDDNYLLTDLKALLEKKDDSVHMPKELRSSDRSNTNPRLAEVPIFTDEEQSLTGLRRLPTAYVCGYIAKRLFIGEKCGQCKAALTTHEYNNDHMFISLKEYDLTKEHLTYPTSNLINLVESLLRSFQDHISDVIFMSGVMASLIKFFNEEIDFDWLHAQCPTHSEDLKSRIVQLFCRILIHNYCKRRNRLVYGKSVKAVVKKKRMKVVLHQ